ncbi:MAG TPA: hypothetical protein VFZ08_10985 [Terriglobia bacterium]|nr:hypothetical protein [Terriglobia bacterium]
MDIERTMQFILDMQAKHSAAVQRHDEEIARNSEQIAELGRKIDTVTDLVGRLAQAEIRLVERMDELAGAQAHSDQRLDALIDVVDKLIRRNGREPEK